MNIFQYPFYPSTHKKEIIVFILIIAFFFQLANAQLTIIVDSIPANTNAEEGIYIASPLSQWNPSDESFKLLKTEDQTYQIVIHPERGAIEFKFTQGSWTKVEVDGNGHDIANRVIQYDGSKQSVHLSIEGWKKEDIITSTAAENVSIRIKDFDMPQLNAKRDIWIYLPPNYKESAQRFPVLYMHDGQNLFDASTSFSGEWQVDESLNQLAKTGDEGVIVVGIENGKSRRIEEYTPWPNEKYGGGNGDAYIQFIVQTLKPYIDQHFRTKSEREHTAIMGSSLGGLISFYAAIKHPEIFGMAGVFSPSFWFTDDIYSLAASNPKSEDVRFYFLSGALESETLLEEIDKMVNLLKEAGHDPSHIKWVTKADGEHNEAFWAREFTDCYLWLFTR